MADDADVLVRVEARITELEKGMKRAQAVANKAYGGMKRDSRSATAAMEADMNRTTMRINQALASTSRHIGTFAKSFAAGFVGGMFAGGLMSFANGVKGVVSELSELGKTIDRVGLSAKTFQELQFGFQLAGVEASTFTRGMESFTQRIGEAATKGNQLGEVFKANGIALRDQAGNLKSNDVLLREYANLVRNAGSEQEQLLLSVLAFGEEAGRKFVNALKNGTDGLDAMARAAEDAGGTIDEELIRKAEELDDRWAASWRRFEINAKSAIMSAVSWMDELSDKADAFLQRQNAAEVGRRVGAMAGRPPSERGNRLIRPDGRVADAFRVSEQDLSTEEAALVADLQRRFGKRTVMPTKPASGGGRNAAAAAALREAEAVQKLIDNLSHELSLIGMSDVEKAKANALRQAGSTATEEQRRQIEQTVEAIYRETEALERNKQAQEARADSIDYLFSMGTDALSSIVDGSMRAEDAIKRLAVQLALAAAQAALLGTGPLAGFFGGGGLGSIFGRADPWAGLRSFDGGGFTGMGARSGGVDGKGGFPALLHPNETVVDHTKASGGGQAVAITVQIDGANGDEHVRSLVAQGVERGLKEYDRTMPARLGGHLNLGRRMGSIR